MNKNKSGKIGDALVGTSYGFISIAAVLTIIHTAWNLLFNLVSGFPLGYDVKGEIRSVDELRSLYVNVARTSTSMGKTELLVWVLVPILFVFVALLVLYRKQFKKVLILSVIFGFLIYGAAFLSNQFDGYVREQQFLKKRFNVTGKIFQKINYPGVLCTFEDSNTWDAAPQFFKCKTEDNIKKVTNFYLEKGFKIENVENESVTLVLEGEIFEPFGKKLSFSLHDDKGSTVFSIYYDYLMIK